MAKKLAVFGLLVLFLTSSCDLFIKQQAVVMITLPRESSSRGSERFSAVKTWKLQASANNHPTIERIIAVGALDAANTIILDNLAIDTYTFVLEAYGENPNSPEVTGPWLFSGQTSQTLQAGPNTIVLSMKNVYTVKFYTSYPIEEALEPYVSISVLADSLLIKPENPVKNGFSFKSWHRANPEDSLAWNFDGDTVQQNTSLIALWQSSSKSIIEFSFDSNSSTSIINQENRTISISIPYGTAINSLTPTITYSGTSISPNSGIAQDFSSQTIYTVTAADGSQQSYTITVSVSPQSDAQAIAEATDVLAIGFASGETASTVSQNLILPSNGLHSSVVSWNSSNTSIISNAGQVTRPVIGQSAANVTLTATISKNAASTTKEFTVTVLPEPGESDEQTVGLAKNALIIGYASGDTASSVTQNLSLPSTGYNGTSISWNSSATASISAIGIVSRPAIGQTEANVTLTATINKNAASTTKEFILTVLPFVSPFGPGEIVTRVDPNTTLAFVAANKPSPADPVQTLEWSFYGRALAAANGNLYSLVFRKVGNPTITASTLSLMKYTGVSSESDENPNDGWEFVKNGADEHFYTWNGNAGLSPTIYAHGNSVYIAFFENPNIILKVFDGTAWSTHSVPTADGSRPFDMYVVSPTEIYLHAMHSGNKTSLIRKWNGTSWETEVSADVQAEYGGYWSMDMLNNKPVLAYINVEKTIAYIKYWNASTWITASQAVSASPYSFRIAALNGQIYAYLNDRHLYRVDGTVFTRLTSSEQGAYHSTGLHLRGINGKLFLGWYTSGNPRITEYNPENGNVISTFTPTFPVNSGLTHTIGFPTLVGEGSNLYIGTVYSDAGVTRYYVVKASPDN